MFLLESPSDTKFTKQILKYAGKFRICPSEVLSIELNKSQDLDTKFQDEKYICFNLLGNLDRNLCYMST